MTDRDTRVGGPRTTSRVAALTAAVAASAGLLLGRSLILGSRHRLQVGYREPFELIGLLCGGALVVLAVWVLIGLAAGAVEALWRRQTGRQLHLPRWTGPAAVRRMAATAIGTGAIVAATFAGPDPESGPAGNDRVPPTMVLLADGRSQPGVPTPTDPTSPRTTPVGDLDQLGGVSTSGFAPISGSFRTVAPGDHFWSLAEDRMAEHLGRRPSEAETRRYWLELIRRNRHLLPDRDDPDLIVPGMRLWLPEP